MDNGLYLNFKVESFYNTSTNIPKLCQRVILFKWRLGSDNHLSERSHLTLEHTVDTTNECFTSIISFCFRTYLPKLHILNGLTCLRISNRLIVLYEHLKCNVKPFFVCLKPKIKNTTIFFIFHYSSRINSLT